ncbi:MAG: HAD family hydrolase [Promethearchaeota archaeon CR_4]|nr:MAG: HAD family hydrolase [Candidatus Lokiarchaeota archaeon CR_4]
MLKGVTFDLWFTLLPSNRKLDSTWRKVRNHETYHILLEHGYLFDYARLKKQIRLFDTQLQEQRRIKGIDFNNDEQVDLFIDFVTHNGRKNRSLHDQIKETFTRPLLTYPPSLGEGVSEMLATLKADGWKIGLISNTGKTPGWTFRQLFDKWGISKYFEDCTFSDEAGAYKPNPRIFRMAEKQLKLQPSELVHVGDMISADICGAIDAGWQAIHFRRYLGLRYLDENARDAQVIDRCPPHEIVYTYPEIVEKLRLLRKQSGKGLHSCQ